MTESVTDDRSTSRGLLEPEIDFDPGPPGIESPDDRATPAVPASALVVEPERRGQAILETLADADCRRILSVVGDTALSASELSESCELPSSTTYRKVEMLTDLGLLAEGSRIRTSEPNVHEYTRVSESATIRFDHGDPLEIRLSRREIPEYLGTFEQG